MDTQKEQRQKELLKLLERAERRQESALENEVDSSPDGASGVLPAEEHIENDEQLIAQCQQHDERRRTAFNQFIRRYQKSVYNYILQIVQEPQKSRELTCAVFVQAYYALPYFQDSSIHVWLLAIAERLLFKSQGHWSRRFLPFRLYQWAQRRLKREDFDATNLAVKDDECRSIEYLLPIYVDGELQNIEARQVETHLAECERCCLRFERIEQTIGTARQVTPIEAPPNIAVSVNEQLGREPIWHSYFESFKTLTRRAPLNASQFVTVLLVVTCIGLGVNLHLQHEKQLTLDVRLGQVTRTLERLGTEQPGVEGQKKTIVILTGVLAEGYENKAIADYIASLKESLEDSLQTIETFSIPGTTSNIETVLREAFSNLSEEQIHDDEMLRETLKVKRLTVEFPIYTPSLLTRYFKEGERVSSELKRPFHVPEASLEIHIIDKRH